MGRAGWARCSVPCVIVLLKDYLVLVSLVTVGGAGQGQQPPCVTSKVLHQCDGGVGEEFLVLKKLGCPPPGQQMFLFCSKSFALQLFLSSFQSSLQMGTREFSSNGAI